MIISGKQAILIYSMCSKCLPPAYAVSSHLYFVFTIAARVYKHHANDFELNHSHYFIRFNKIKVKHCCSIEIL